jgi:purine-binding chemotaxis protein CheW
MVQNTSQEKSQEIQLIIFKIADEEFAVNIHQVREIVRMMPITTIPRSAEFIEGVVNLRGQVLIIMDLAKRLGLKALERGERTRIVVVEVEETSIGMIVDNVTEVLRLGVDKIVKTPDLTDVDITKKYITGIGKLKDRLLILIDLAAILSTEEIEHAQVVSEVKEQTQPKENKKAA